MNSKVKYCIYIVLSAISCHSQNSLLNDFEIRDVINSTDIERTSFPKTEAINLYQGNGKFGSSFGPLGLHVNLTSNDNPCAFGKTQYMHLEHRIRAKFGSDYLIPLAKILIHNIYSHLGVKISGEINNDSATLFMTAWKNCEFDLSGEKITMEENQEVKINLNLKTKQIIFNDTI